MSSDSDLSVETVSSVASVSSVGSTDESEADEQHRRLRRPRQFRARPRPFLQYNDEEFKARFRLTKATFVHLLGLVGDNIQPFTARNAAISSENQLLLALRFYATGSFQNVIGDHFNVTKATAGRIIHEVTHHIASLRPRYIGMPTTETTA